MPITRLTLLPPIEVYVATSAATEPFPSVSEPQPGIPWAMLCRTDRSRMEVRSTDDLFRIRVDDMVLWDRAALTELLGDTGFRVSRGDDGVVRAAISAGAEATVSRCSFSIRGSLRLTDNQPEVYPKTTVLDALALSMFSKALDTPKSNAPVSKIQVDCVGTLELGLSALALFAPSAGPQTKCGFSIRGPATVSLSVRD